MNPDNKIVAIGHNDLPQGSREDFPYWENRDIDKDGFEKTKYAYGKTEPTIYTIVALVTE